MLIFICAILSTTGTSCVIYFIFEGVIYERNKLSHCFRILSLLTHAMTSGVGSSSDCVMYFQCTNYLVIASKLIWFRPIFKYVHTHTHTHTHMHTQTHKIEIINYNIFSEDLFSIISRECFMIIDISCISRTYYIS